MMVNASPDSRHASQVLMAAIAASDAETVTVGEIADLLERRAYGFVLALVGLINCVPLPPGVSSLAGIPVFLVGLQMVAGRSSPWLPASIRRRLLKRRELLRVLYLAEPYLRRIERLSHRRLPGVVRIVSPYVVGGMVVALSLFIMIPMMFTNIPPAFATVFLAIALIEEDGLMLALGLALAIVAMAISTVLAAGTIAIVLVTLRSLFGL